MTQVLLACAQHKNEVIELLRHWGGWIFCLAFIWVLTRRD